MEILYYVVIMPQFTNKKKPARTTDQTLKLCVSAVSSTYIWFTLSHATHIDSPNCEQTPTPQPPYPRDLYL